MFNFKKMERPWAPVPLPFVGGPAKIRKSYYFLSEIDLCVERKLKKKKKIIELYQASILTPRHIT